jgi:membrane protease YdiL (CAAX protease family)
MYILKQLFWNRDQARLRAGWRILVYNGLWFILFYAAFGLRNTVLARWLPEVYRTPVAVAIHTLLVVVLLLGLVGSRLLDRRPLADYGFHLNKGWWLDLGFGLALGTLLMLGIFGVEQALGWTEITGTFVTADPTQRFGPVIVVVFTTILLIAAEEEITWRGYMLQNLAEGLNLKGIGPRLATLSAVLLSSALFGLGHAANLGATTFSTINTMVFAGLVLAGGYVLTGELALPIGFHIAWNCVQVGVGYSGGARQLGAAFFAISQHGPEWLTGGEYGHEAGLLGTGVFILSFLLIAAWVRLRRGRVRLDPSVAQPPARRAASAARPAAAPAP